MLLTKDELRYINAAPPSGTIFTASDLLPILRYPGWNNTQHRGWHQWRVEQSLLRKGLLRKIRGGRGRGNKLEYMVVL